MIEVPGVGGGWNYRVIRKTHEHRGKKYVTFGIHEVYYHRETHKPVMCSVDPIAPHGEIFGELKQDLEWMQEALNESILNYEDIVCEESNLETVEESDWGCEEGEEISSPE